MVWAHATACIPDGPMQAICPEILGVIKLAHASAWVRELSGYYEPTRVHRQQCICIKGRCKHFASGTIPFPSMPSNDPTYRDHTMGPDQCLGQRSFRLLWANSSSSAVAMHVHHRPMQVSFLAGHSPSVNCMGPCNHFVLQLTP
jgi:hypothetical protein